MKVTLLLLLFPLLWWPLTGFAQKAVLKTNLLHWATLSPNVGVEFATGKRHSVAVQGGGQFWEYSDNKKLKHWLVQPEFRWWLCETFNGHYIGVHALGGQFNAGGIDLPFGIFDELETKRYQGWAAGAGVAWGYHWMLNRRWSLEFGIGLGYLYIDYKKYKCVQCGKAQQDTHRNYLGPTKAAISIVYAL